MSEDSSAPVKTPDDKPRPRPSEEHEYRYSGIRVREGYVPFWIWLVILALIIWSIWYLINEWQMPPPG